MSFKRLEEEDFVVSADAVQGICWSTGAPTLTSFHTSSVQQLGSSGNYYLAVYQTSSDLSTAAVQFDIAYGNKHGSGSSYFNPLYPSRTPSSVIYGQYRSMILEDENAVFLTGIGTTGQVNQCGVLITSSTAVEMEDFWVISPDRARYKQSLFPGTFNLTLSGSGGEITLTDNSNDVTIQTFLGTSRVYQIVSGSNGSGISGGGYTPDSGSYGLFFPDIATILLNPEAINFEIGVASDKTANLANGVNNSTFYEAMVDGSSFQLNFEETITSDYIFVRARNAEFNYSENPSFISGSTGEVIYSNFINNPQTYPTTIGMYNDSNELMAVAKLSRPLLKDFTKESLVRVKLDF
tara:strand:- start:1028 stop:2080 length:1053 start_codon:yes stop_codon:yes gene_type:complete